MSTETLSRNNPKNEKFENIESNKIIFDQQISNKDLNKVCKNSFKKKKNKNLHKFFTRKT